MVVEQHQIEQNVVRTVRSRAIYEFMERIRVKHFSNNSHHIGTSNTACSKITKLAILANFRKNSPLRVDICWKTITENNNLIQVLGLLLSSL